MKLDLNATYPVLATRLGYSDEFKLGVDKLVSKAKENGEELSLLDLKVGDGRLVALFCQSKVKPVAKPAGGSGGRKTSRSKANVEQPESKGA